MAVLVLAIVPDGSATVSAAESHCTFVSQLHPSEAVIASVSPGVLWVCDSSDVLKRLTVLVVLVVTTGVLVILKIAVGV